MRIVCFSFIEDPVNDRDQMIILYREDISLLSVLRSPMGIPTEVHERLMFTECDRRIPWNPDLIVGDSESCQK